MEGADDGKHIKNGQRKETVHQIKLRQSGAKETAPLVVSTHNQCLLVSLTSQSLSAEFSKMLSRDRGET